MASEKHINIQFPFKDSENGFLVALTTEDSVAIKSDLMHLLLTRKGERLYNPAFGTNLLKFIFEPNDGLTYTDIDAEIRTTTKRYLPNLTITSLLIEKSPDNEWTAIVTIQFTISDDVFVTSDFISITL